MYESIVILWHRNDCYNDWSNVPFYDTRCFKE